MTLPPKRNCWVSSLYLLDTCVFLWAAMEPEMLSVKARKVLTDQKTTVYLSVASGWEILGKSTKGKLDLGPGSSVDALRRHVTQLNGLRLLPIRIEHLYESYGLPLIHKDPIDRILIGQARTEHMTLITPDREIQKYDLALLW
jgi:PIN domain nuclease of toxin-antitoxin system